VFFADCASLPESLLFLVGSSCISGTIGTLRAALGVRAGTWSKGGRRRPHTSPKPKRVKPHPSLALFGVALFLQPDVENWVLRPFRPASWGSGGAVGIRLEFPGLRPGLYSVGLTGRGTRIFGLKGRWTIAQGESLGSMTMRAILPGPKGRRATAQSQKALTRSSRTVFHTSRIWIRS
jgi:hypothetical protein